MDNSSAMLGLLKRNKELIYIYIFSILYVYLLLDILEAWLTTLI